MSATSVESLVLYRDFAVMLGLSVLLFLMSYGFRGPGRISRLSGVILLGIYLAYQCLVFYTEYGKQAG